MSSGFGLSHYGLNKGHTHTANLHLSFLSYNASLKWIPGFLLMMLPVNTTLPWPPLPSLVHLGQSAKKLLKLQRKEEQKKDKVPRKDQVIHQ
jgi:hypothetical protein